MKNFVYILALCFGLLLVISCSPQSTGLIADPYHNTTAHYNGYFLAKEKIIEAEQKLFNQRKDNYNRILHVYPKVDTNRLKTFEKDMKSTIKSAAFALERHPNSKWADDCYVVVGKARFMLQELPTAINTFKYVNGHAQDDDAKQQALIELMKTYIYQGDMQDAEVVKNVLHRLGIDKSNTASFYLAQAHFLREKKDYPNTQKSIALALPKMPKGEPKARIYFLNGQLLDHDKKPKEAYKSYKKVRKNNPSYELRFYTKLAMLLSTDQQKTSKKKIEKGFQKMLKDEKNIDYLDKIYYDMSTYEMKNGNFDKCVEYLNDALEESTTNKAQKGYTFLRLAEIHFERLQQYELAKTYYDSTLAFLPKDEENYEKIAIRQKVLGDFLQYITTIQLQDSLQMMAQYNESDLDDFLTKNLTEKIKMRKAFEKKKRQRQLEKARKRRSSSTLDQYERTKNSAGFYFANPTLVVQGSQAFRKKWGDRPLVDNWRVKSKMDLSEIPEDQLNVEPLSAEELERRSTQKEMEQTKKELTAMIPRNQAAIDSSNAMIETALYKLGKIYHFELVELPEAITSYKDLLKRNPKSDLEPELLYLLYLANRDLKKQAEVEKYKRLAEHKYPNSTYTKLISNPDFLKQNKEIDIAAQKEYAKAYQLFEQENFEACINALDEISTQYPNNSIQDKIDYVKILCVGRLGDIAQYKTLLQQFTTNHTSSKLTDNVNQILQTIKAK